jgi:hypothetical protein
MIQALQKEGMPLDGDAEAVIGRVFAGVSVCHILCGFLC